MPSADQLNAAKARALVRDNFGATDLTESSLPGGTALRDTSRGFVYDATASGKGLGRLLALGAAHGLVELHLLIDTEDFDAARRAALLTPPVPVWVADGRALRPVAAPPRIERTVDLADPALAPLVDRLRDAGLDVLVEHGVVTGEVRGLEVARIVTGPDGAPELAVGVGRFDQEANRAMSGAIPLEQALINAISEVRVHRHRHARAHPVNRLARERWLRSQLIADPSLVGLAELAPVPLGAPRPNVRDPFPAAAVGRDGAGRRVLVMCTVGVDLDLVPQTADVADREQPDRIAIALAARDRLAIQDKLAARLAWPVEFATVEGEWTTVA